MPTSTRPIADVARELGLAPEEWLPYGRDKAKVVLPALAARREQPDGRLVVVSSITPTPAGDGKTVMLGLQNEREWAAFCEKVLRRPELTNDERFASNSKRAAARQALRSIISDSFSELTAEQVSERLDEAQIAELRGAFGATW